MRSILVDIDIKMEYMEKYGLIDILHRKIEYCSRLIGINVLWVNIEKSQCGNTHLRIIVDNTSNMDIIKFKYCVGEDHKRLTHTIRRYEKTGKILDFFYMSNVKKCVE